MIERYSAKVSDLGLDPHQTAFLLIGIIASLFIIFRYKNSANKKLGKPFPKVSEAKDRKKLYEAASIEGKKWQRSLSIALGFPLMIFSATLPFTPTGLLTLIFIVLVLLGAALWQVDELSSDLGHFLRRKNKTDEEKRFYGVLISLFVNRLTIPYMIGWLMLILSLFYRLFLLGVFDEWFK